MELPPGVARCAETLQRRTSSIEEQLFDGQVYGVHWIQAKDCSDHPEEETDSRRNIRFPRIQLPAGIPAEILLIDHGGRFWEDDVLLHHCAEAET